MDSVKNLIPLAFGVIAVGLLSLFAIDYVFVLLTSGHADPEQQKFIRDMISFFLGGCASSFGHYSVRNNPK